MIRKAGGSRHTRACTDATSRRDHNREHMAAGQNLAAAFRAGAAAMRGEGGSRYDSTDAKTKRRPKRRDLKRPQPDRGHKLMRAVVTGPEVIDVTLPVEGGFLGDRGWQQQSAPASFSEFGPYVGIGIKF